MTPRGELCRRLAAVLPGEHLAPLWMMYPHDDGGFDLPPKDAKLPRHFEFAGRLLRGAFAVDPELAVLGITSGHGGSWWQVALDHGEPDEDPWECTADTLSEAMAEVVLSALNEASSAAPDPSTPDAEVGSE